MESWFLWADFRPHFQFTSGLVIFWHKNLYKKFSLTFSVLKFIFFFLFSDNNFARLIYSVFLVIDCHVFPFNDSFSSHVIFNSFNRIELFSFVSYTSSFSSFIISSVFFFFVLFTSLSLTYLMIPASHLISFLLISIRIFHPDMVETIKKQKKKRQTKCSSNNFKKPELYWLFSSIELFFLFFSILIQLDLNFIIIFFN